MSRQSLLLSALIAFVCLFIVYFVTLPVTPLSAYRDYRLAENLRLGYGLVFNHDSNILEVISPFWPFLIAFSPFEPHTTDTILWLLGVALSGGLLYDFLRSNSISSQQSTLAILLWAVAWPLWAGTSAASIWAWLLVILAMRLSQVNRPAFAGLAAGLAPLFHVGSLIGVILLGLSSKATCWRYIVLPLLLWAILSIVVFDEFVLNPTTLLYQHEWHVLSQAAFVISILLLYRTRRDILAPVLWIIPIWACLESLVNLILNGAIPSASLPALVFTLAMGATLLMPQAIALVPTFIFILVLFPPQVAPQISNDLALGATLPIPTDASLTHSHTVALPYGIEGFTGSTYALRDSGERMSQIVQLAPDFVLTDTLAIDFVEPGLAALRYEEVESNLWRRGMDVASWQPFENTGFAFGQDLHLEATRTDHSRLVPGSLLRIGLRWETTNSPGDYPMTLQINLLDRDRQAFGTIFPQIPSERWADQPLETYYALAVPDNLAPGVYTVNLAVDYRASILSQHDILSLVLPFPDTGINRETVLGDLGQMVLHHEQYSIKTEQVQIEYIWGAQEDILQEYMVFLHLSTLDDLTPIIQDTSPPVGGRYPSTMWRAGDIIRDNRQLDLSAISPGSYRLNIGFFAPESNTRMGDTFITTNLVTITEDREIVISPFQESSD